ncbi:MAG: hypothetical protein LW817_08690, partial [Candidatus Caenarcaniphilales bacterium]|nr:hypothetical protein [Candidatus Caenarcaniphilales bacterium]
QPWLLFFFRSLRKQKQKLQSKVSKETILSLHLKPLEAEIVNNLEQHGKLSISQMLQLITCSRNTLKKTLALMIEESKIKRHGKGKATWYTL